MAINVDELATALRDAMPRSSEVVDRHHRFGESELAIPAALAVFAQESAPLPASLRRQIEELADAPGTWHKFARSIRDELVEIPIKTSA
jgi:hypothetical protein